MNVTRRHVLRLAAGVLASAASAALWPLRAFAEALEQVFKAESLEAIHAALGGRPEVSDQI